MKYLFSKHYFIFFVSFAIILHIILKNFTPFVVPDTASYLRLDSFSESLAGQRTPFFGLIAKFFHLIDPSYTILILFNNILFFLSIIILYKSGLIYGLQKSTSACLSVPILYSNPALLNLNYIHPEILSISLILISISSVLIIASEKGGIVWFIIGPFTTAFACLLKPGFILFIFTIPFLLWIFSNEKSVKSKFNKLINIFLFFIISLLPILLYSGLRYHYVNSFHIVSSGGYQSLGIAGVLLDLESNNNFTNIPIKYKELSEVVISDKINLELKNEILITPLNSSGVRSLTSVCLGYYDIIARNYDPLKDIIWSKIYIDGNSWVEANILAQNFVFSVIKSNPMNYIACVAGGSTRFVGLVTVTNFIFMISVSFLLLSIFNSRKYLLSDFKIKEIDNEFNKNFFIIFFITFIYSFSSILPSLILSFPARRYIDTAGIFNASLPFYIGLLFLKNKFIKINS
jgi:hypothetical protein